MWEYSSPFFLDIKHKKRNKARLVARAYLVDVSVSSTHSGAVLLKGIQPMLFLDKLNESES